METLGLILTTTGVFMIVFTGVLLLLRILDALT